jgi:hypothetical protein
MRSHLRRLAVITLTAGLVLILAIPASAERRIFYRGESSEGYEVFLAVLKRDNGRRFVDKFRFGFSATCENGSTSFGNGLDFGYGRRRLRLGSGGEFEYSNPRTPPSEPSEYTWHFAGTMRFGSAEGTLEVRYAALTKDDEAQLCTSGIVDWSADRRRSILARSSRGTLQKVV